MGGGWRGAVDLCARVTVVDEEARVLLDAFVRPTIPITDYRTLTSGVTAADMKNALPFKQIRRTVRAMLQPNATAGAAGAAAGLAAARASLHPPVLVVGRGLQAALHTLMMDHPAYLLRDVKQCPLFFPVNGDEGGSLEEASGAVRLFRQTNGYDWPIDENNDSLYT